MLSFASCTHSLIFMIFSTTPNDDTYFYLPGNYMLFLLSLDFKDFDKC